MEAFPTGFFSFKNLRCGTIMYNWGVMKRLEHSLADIKGDQSQSNHRYNKLHRT